MVLNMERISRILGFALVLYFLGVQEVEAQKTRLRYADEQMNLMNYHHALEIYVQAYEKKPTYETAKKVAKAHDKLKDYDQAFNWWKNVLAYEASIQEDQVQFLRTAEIIEKLPEARAILLQKGVAIEGLEIATRVDSRAFRNLKVENLKDLNSTESDFFLVEDMHGNKYFVSDRGPSYSKKMPGIRIDGRNKFFSQEFSSQTDRLYFSIFKKTKMEKLAVLYLRFQEPLVFPTLVWTKRTALCFFP